MKRIITFISLCGLLLSLLSGCTFTPGDTESGSPSGQDPASAPTSSVTVSLNEYATSDTVTYADEDGDFVSWVELYNYGTSTVSLSGFTLSESPRNGHFRM